MMHLIKQMSLQSRNTLIKRAIEFNYPRLYLKFSHSLKDRVKYIKLLKDNFYIVQN